VRRRSLVLALAVLAALACAAPALALSVHVRVEGVNSTLFGAAEPLLPVYEGPLVASDQSVHTLAAPTALGALEAASRKAELYYRLKAASFGLYVDQVGRYPAAGSSGWVYKVNGATPPVGAADYVLEEGDRVVWYHATFGASGGPATLDLRARRAGCWAAVLLDDAGKATAARDVVFRLDDRRVRDADGVYCPGGHWHRLRATKAGAVASQTVLP
jgi:hypothetical protein